MSFCSSSSSSSTKSWIVHGIIAGAAVAVAIGAHTYLGRSRNFRSRVVGIIPARFASSRFQGKPLVRILGKPMIQVHIIFPLFFLLIGFILFVNYGSDVGLFFPLRVSIGNALLWVCSKLCFCFYCNQLNIE